MQSFIDKVVAIDGYRVRISVIKDNDDVDFQFDVMEIVAPSAIPKSASVTAVLK